MNSFLSKLNQRPVAYYPIYKEITGSVHGAILLSQLMYWFSKKPKFYKPADEIMEEIGFTERELKTAKAHLKKAVFVTVTKEGMPAKTYYEIDWGCYENELRKLVVPCQDETVQSSQDETVQSSQDETVQSSQDETVSTSQDETVSTITENTSETTTEKKTETKVEIVYGLWISYKNLIQHRSIPERTDLYLRKLLKDYKLEEILSSIKVYSKALSSAQSWLNHQWTLAEFLRKEQACRKIMDSAPNYDWLKRIGYANTSQPTRSSVESNQYSEEETNIGELVV